MCDEAGHTKAEMQRGFSCIYRNLPLVSTKPDDKQGQLEDRLAIFI